MDGTEFTNKTNSNEERKIPWGMPEDRSYWN